MFRRNYVLWLSQRHNIVFTLIININITVIITFKYDDYYIKQFSSIDHELQCLLQADLPVKMMFKFAKECQGS